MNNNEYRLMPVALLPAIRDALIETGKCLMPDHVWAAIIEAHDRVAPVQRVCADLVMEDAGPEDFGIPAEWAERARLYGNWLTHRAAAPAGSFEDAVARYEHMAALWLDARRRIRELEAAAPERSETPADEIRDAALEEARAACIEMMGSLQRGAYREACMGCANAIQLLKYSPAPAVSSSAAPIPIDQQMARWAIDGAILKGRIGENAPPNAEHWLMEYWMIGQQLAKLGETSAWDNVTPVDAPSEPLGFVDGKPVFVGAELEQLTRKGWVRHNAQESWRGQNIDWLNDLRWPDPSPTGESLSIPTWKDRVDETYGPNVTAQTKREIGVSFMLAEIAQLRAALATPSVQGVAAAGQELTDADIDRIVSAAVKKGDLSWLGYRKDEDGVYTVPVLSPGHYQLCRAIERHLAGNTPALPGEGGA